MTMHLVLTNTSALALSHSVTKLFIVQKCQI